MKPREFWIIPSSGPRASDTGLCLEDVPANGYIKKITIRVIEYFAYEELKKNDFNQKVYINSLESENKILREALAFYASESWWIKASITTPWLRAQEALAKCGNTVSPFFHLYNFIKQARPETTNREK